MNFSKKKGKKEELPDQLKAFLHESRSLHSKKSVIALAKQTEGHTGALPKGVKMIWRGEAHEGNIETKLQMLASDSKHLQFEQDRLDKQSKEAEEYVGPIVRDDLKQGKKKASRKLLAVDGWRESVRPMWSKAEDAADVKALLREAHAADMVSSQALAEAGETRNRVLSRAGSRASRGVSHRGGGTVAGNITSYFASDDLEGGRGREGNFQVASRVPTASTVRSKAMSVVGGGRGEGGGTFRSRSHSAMEVLPGDGIDPQTLVPFAAPFRAGSAHHKLTRAPRRPTSTGPPRPSSAHIHIPDPDLPVEERMEAIAKAGTYYHRKRTDITSAQQTRAGFGKKKEWLSTITKPLPPPVPCGIEDFQEKKRSQQAHAREIAAAANKPPIHVPITFEPVHSAMPMNRGVGEDWAYNSKFLPQSYARWNPGNKDPPYVSHSSKKPSWGPMAYSN